MTLAHGLFLFAVATIGGALNTVAGGGSFLTFPSLIFVGISPVVANATNSVAIWPAGVAGAFAYRHEMRNMGRTLAVLGIASFLGGLLGAILLLLTPDTAFMSLVPWLLLAATLLFNFGGLFTARMRKSPLEMSDRPQGPTTVSFVLQFVIGVYGGYFGGGMGIMMLATLAMMGMTNILTMNAVKTVLTTVINGIAIVAFIVAGKVIWGPALLMAVGATGGGYFGAFASRKVAPKWMRRFVLVVAWAMTAYFFIKQYAGHFLPKH